MVSTIQYLHEFCLDTPLNSIITIIQMNRDATVKSLDELLFETTVLFIEFA